MNTKTIVLMSVAVACGLGASYMTSQMLKDRRKEPEEVKTVPVLVATARVPGWRPIKEPGKFFEVKEYPEELAPKNALGQLTDIQDQRLNKSLDAGKPVTQEDLLTKEQQTVADQLQAGQRAIAIRVNAESLAGGFVLPGSRVDVILTRKEGNASAMIVLQNMLVLAVDNQVERNPETKSIIGQTVTLAATPAEATRLTLAGTVGELRLTLKGHGDTGRVLSGVMRVEDLQRPLTSASSSGDFLDTDQTPSTTSPLVPLPLLPPEEKGEKSEKAEKAAPPSPAPAPVVRMRKRPHVMTIINGLQRDRTEFVDGLGEDLGDSSVNESRRPRKSDTKTDTARSETGKGKKEKSEDKEETEEPESRKSDKK